MTVLSDGCNSDRTVNIEEIENLKMMVDTLNKENQSLKMKNEKKGRFCLCNWFLWKSA